MLRSALRWVQCQHAQLVLIEFTKHMYVLLLALQACRCILEAGRKCVDLGVSRWLGVYIRSFSFIFTDVREWVIVILWLDHATTEVYCINVFRLNFYVSSAWGSASFMCLISHSFSSFLLVLSFKNWRSIIIYPYCVSKTASVGIRQCKFRAISRRFHDYSCLFLQRHERDGAAPDLTAARWPRSRIYMATAMAHYSDIPSIDLSFLRDVIWQKLLSIVIDIGKLFLSDISTEKFWTITGLD